MIINLNIKLLLTTVLLIGAVPAFANDKICADIQRQLNGGQLMIGNSAETRALTQAINSQNAFIRQIRSDMRRYGCSVGSVIVYGDKNAELCGELGDRLIEARAEIDYLTSERQQLQLSRRTDLSDFERQELEDAFDAYDCARQGMLAPPQRGMSDEYLDGYGDEISPQAPPPDTGPIPSASSQGPFRTMCVRSCDGKFYPVSSNASPLDFSRQKAQCQSSCQGSETDLYYHALVGAETKDMVSASTGQPYSQAPNAYKFQSTTENRPKNCSCGPLGSVEFGEKPATASEGSSAITEDKAPKEKIEPKDITQQTGNIEKQMDEGRPYIPGERKVRTVGPQFFPQDSSIDLSKPAKPGAQPQQ